ncbi:hypothetical protein Tco_0802978 [Tanacetum coccineum]|uniref:Reverse transcriptase domain-containing protein n=1 Tax=Tanacetum coccineum TaxID=301880 RepID=A0ABQ5A4D0_9ASTR
MLERLAGNEFYCFLDGFSGYFQIPIDPKDQEKTTFTCPTYKVPEENKLQRKTYDIGSFIKWFCRQTGKKKLCKADLEGPAFNLVKAFHKNNVFLQYQMDECHKLLTNKVDLSNPEGHQILRNIYEPLPLGGPPGQWTAEYDISAVYGITHWWFRRKEFYINKHSEPSNREAVRSHMRILSVISVKEKDFRILPSNDFEVCSLPIFKKSSNPSAKTEQDSYQTKINLERPNWDASPDIITSKKITRFVPKQVPLSYRDRNDQEVDEANELH